MSLDTTSYRYETMGSREGNTCQARKEQNKIKVYIN